MEPMPIPVTPLAPDDLAALARAKRALESKPLAMKLAGAIGAPLERLMARLPAAANETIAEATRRALGKCLDVALGTFGEPSAEGDGNAQGNAERRRMEARGKPRDLLHKLAVATTGAAGGAFGLMALPAELPVTTTLMFRSICDIARSEGEDLAAIETQLQCLAVFGLGGGGAKAGEEADLGYFVARGALAQAVSKASSDIASKGIAGHSAPALLRLMNAIAARFSVQVSEQVAAKSIPAIGAVLGALVNTVFIGHFQQTAHGHFTVRRLERRYGTDAVRTAYQAIDVSPDS
jgi:EcsC protein family